MGVVTLSNSDIEVDDDGDSGHSGGDDDHDFAPSAMPTVTPGPSRRTRAFTRAMPPPEAAVARSSRHPSSSQGDVVPGHITEYPGFSVHHRTVAGLVEHTFHPAADPSISYSSGCTHVSNSNIFYSFCDCICILTLSCSFRSLSMRFPVYLHTSRPARPI